MTEVTLSQQLPQAFWTGSNVVMSLICWCFHCLETEKKTSVGSTAVKNVSVLVLCTNQVVLPSDPGDMTGCWKRSLFATLMYKWMSCWASCDSTSICTAVILHIPSGNRGRGGEEWIDGGKRWTLRSIWDSAKNNRMNGGGGGGLVGRQLLIG